MRYYVGLFLSLFALNLSASNSYNSDIVNEFIDEMYEKHDYKKDIPVCSGPLYKSHEIKGDQVIIQFDHVGSGLMAGSKFGMEATQETDEELKYFQICGADRQWKWAQAEITGKDTVTVSHPKVRKPVVVRYAWAQNPESANLYNKEGLPASIFTTEAEIRSDR